MYEKILRLPQVLEVTGLKRSTLYELRAEGEFPYPVKLGKRAVGWRSGDVQKWIEQRQSAKQ